MKGFLLTFLGIFITATVLALFANALKWPAFAVGAGNFSLFRFEPGTNGMLGVGAFHISMFVGLVSGVLAFLPGVRRR